MAKVTVIRVIKYEGDEDAVRKAIQMSKPLGVTDCGRGDGGHWQMTIAEHFNDLPKLAELTEDDINRSLADVRLRKLLGYMASNVKEGGWEKVQDMGGVAGWVGMDEALHFLDMLPECNVGLMEKVNDAND